MFLNSLSDAIRREEIRESVRRQHHEAEVSRSSGVRIGGTEPEAFRERSDAEQRAAAHAAYERTKAFGASARGRFLLALRSLESVGYTAEVYVARGACSRGFMDEREAVDPREVGCALTALAEINHSDARTAIACLGEILAGAPQQKAA